MALTIAFRRIRRELQEVIKSNNASECDIKLELLRDHHNFAELKAEIAGPPNTPYEGGKFTLEIILPSLYPFFPPSVRFVTKIWHPNISSHTGAIGLDILKNAWTPALSLRIVLLSVLVMLSAPNADHPEDVVVAEEFIRNPREFDLTARNWTNVFAKYSDSL